MQGKSHRLYRAVKAPRQMEVPRVSTNRAPGNLPYLVDNIWEWLRPAGMPSRRRAAFAAPLPELAAKAAGLSIEHVYVVALREGQGFAQLVQGSDPSDARYHPDVSRIRKAVHGSILPKGWLDTPAAARGPLAGLFLPCLEKAEIEACLAGVDPTPLHEASSFWRDIRMVEVLPELHPAGEIFFEGAYALTPL